jgi:hypothetical protein
VGSLALVAAVAAKRVIMRHFSPAVVGGRYANMRPPRALPRSLAFTLPALPIIAPDCEKVETTNGIQGFSSHSEHAPVADP